MTVSNLIGLFLPPAIDLINTKVANEKARYVVSVLICMLVGVLTNLDKLSNIDQLMANIALIFATAQTTYNLYWKKSKSRKKFIK